MGSDSRRAKTYAPWLWSLTGLFALRVAAQPLALIWDRLPRFDDWHSQTLPYGWLLFSQIVILGLMGYVSFRYSSGRVAVARGRAWVFLMLGGLYLTVMIARLLLGVTAMQGDPWFDRPLPTLFHLVLASFLIAVGAFHRQASSP
jgi:hypothetical protein